VFNLGLGLESGILDRWKSGRQELKGPEPNSLNGTKTGFSRIKTVTAKTNEKTVCSFSIPLPKTVYSFSSRNRKITEVYENDPKKPVIGTGRYGIFPYRFHPYLTLKHAGPLLGCDDPSPTHIFQMTVFKEKANQYNRTKDRHIT
jgi:hypothetical protein